MQKNDNFLMERNEFSERIGIPNLYEFIDHFALYAGIHTIANKLWTYELLTKTKGIPGDIIEFGCWNGSNLMFLAKMISLLEPNSPKKVVGFDNFSGLPQSHKMDGNYAKQQVGKYRGNENVLRQAISLFNLTDRIELVVGDALKTIPNFHINNPHSILSFAYLDFDLYEPTKEALIFIEDSLSVGGIIVFDEACTKDWPGETLAMKEFLAHSKNHFTMLSNLLSQNPTTALLRIS